jgi:hypothetical protein
MRRIDDNDPFAKYRWDQVDTRPADGWKIDVWEIRRRFIALRKKTRLTQKKLGDIIRLCYQQISEIENAHVIPHARTWARFAALEKKHRQRPVEMPTHWS